MPNAARDEAPKPTTPETEDWRELAEKASNEQDPKKLLETVARLCDSIDKRQAAQAALRKGPPAKP